MTFREDCERRGFKNLQEVQELFRCVLSAQGKGLLKSKGLSKQQIDWLMQHRRRAELFLEVIND